jgi:hypothetical protein
VRSFADAQDDTQDWRCRNWCRASALRAEFSALPSRSARQPVPFFATFSLAGPFFRQPTRVPARLADLTITEVPIA